MLSNTATPKYYGQFRQAVLDGRIPINKKIELQMNRIDRRIKNPNFYYDDQAINGYVEFCESELCLNNGGALKLMDTFKLWAEDALSWFYFVERSVYVPNEKGGAGHYKRIFKKRRLTNKQYLIVARGAAKTLYEASQMCFGLVCDRETTHQVAVGPTIHQGELILLPIKTAISKRLGPLFQVLCQGTIHNTTGMDGIKLASTKKGIENFLTNSILEVLPMSIDKLQGLDCKYAAVDEWLSGDDVREDVIGAIEQGATKNADNDYLIFSVSSEGTIRNGIGDSIKLELDDILNGVYEAENVSIWWYRLDDIKEVSNPAMWVKAQPNIGITVSYDVYQRDVERAEKVPAVRNDILAKRFGLPVEGFTYFFTYNETLPHPKKTYWNMACSLGVDLSQGDDFCAFTFLFPMRGERYGIKTRAYISERTLLALSPAMRLKYNEFLDEGTLIVMENTINLNMKDIEHDLEEFIQRCGYDVRCIGYDPYNANDFLTEWVYSHGSYGLEIVRQGVKTETVPLGELKKLSEDRLLLFDEKLMSFAFGNCVVAEDTNGNRKLYKKRREEKIDNVSALMDAYVAYKIHSDDFA